MSTFYGLKIFVIFLGSSLVMIGSGIEPSLGIWIISLGGTLLTAALGKDKTFTGILFYLPTGIGWGIFGSQVIHSVSLVPQTASAFFMAMFGGEATFYIIKSFRESTFFEFMLEVINALTPFKKKL